MQEEKSVEDQVIEVVEVQSTAKKTWQKFVEKEKVKAEEVSSGAEKKSA